MPGIKVIFGGASFGTQPDRVFNNVEIIKQVLTTLQDGGCDTIDTAALYQGSEDLLGKAGAAQAGFTIDTKAPGGFTPGGATRDQILAQSKSSKERLGQNVDIYYLHSPAKDTPLEETLEAINELHQSGFCKRWGLSNFTPEDVQKAYDLCKQKGYTLPAVFQGNYSAVARRQEEALFPTLRKLGMSFYAYSPLAGGFLTKTKQQILDKHGRFDPDTIVGQIYTKMYNRPAYLEALAEWERIAEEEGCSRAELAYRWVSFHSPLKPEFGDALIFGATRLEQVASTINGMKKGPLSDEAVKAIDHVWKTIEHEAPLDNFAG